MTKRMPFRGSMVALVTPFKQGKVDEQALRLLIDWQIAQGTDVLVPCGTTGESATLSHAEHDRVIALTIEHAKGRVPVVAGTGSNSTDEAVSLTTHAAKAGVDGCLLVTPYYNKPTQEGLYQHYKTIASQVDVPLILYNVPGRTGCNLLPETVARLAHLDNIVGIKEATGNMQQVSDVIALAPEDFAVISGDDFITMPMLHIGAVGTISVTANIVPQDMAAMCDAYFNGEHDKAMGLHYKMRPLSQAMFLETNPIPVKAALAMMGRVAAEWRLPLTPPSEVTHGKIHQALIDYGAL